MVEAARTNGRALAPVLGYPALAGICKIGEFVLQSGVRLGSVDVGYQLIGPSEAPVIAVLGGISADRFAAQTATPKRGWWADQIGPGQALDTRKYRVLCWDFLGGNGVTTGARSHGLEGRAFPDVTTLDQAHLLAALLGRLGIAKLHAFLGASYGGMVALQLGVHLPELVTRLVVISAAHRSAPMAVALRTLQRQLVEQSLVSGDGLAGLALARTLAMATYRTPEEFTERFGHPGEEPLSNPDRSPVWAYLSARGAAYIEQMHPRAFLCLSRSIDLHHLKPEHLQVPVQLIAVRQDQLVPVALIEELASTIVSPCKMLHLDSLYGHDAFLKESIFFNKIFAAL